MAQDLTNAAATLVQLLALFKQERPNAKDLSHREFIEWLDYHRHEDLKELITRTYHLSSEVDALLREDHEVIMAKLDNVSSLVDLLGHIEGLKGVTQTLVPDLGLSEDAAEVIAWSAHRRAVRIVMLPDGSGRVQLEGVGGLVIQMDPRFVDDDLNSLVAHGLIATDLVRETWRSFKLTRRGQKFGEMLPLPPMPEQQNQ